MASWFPVMTDAGRAAIQAADGLGLSTSVTQVGLGTSRYAVRNADGTPTPLALAATGLKAERLRVPCYAGGSVEPGSLLILAQVARATAEADAFYISEIGFYDKNGVLLVVWSDLTGSMGYRGVLADWNLTLSFSWRDMPSGSITVQVVNAAFSDQLLATAQMQAKMRHLAGQSGVPYYPNDPAVLTNAVEAKVNQAVASLNKPIRQPIAVTPTGGATGQILIPLLRGSNFFSADGYSHVKSQFIILKQDGTVLHDSGEVAPTVEYTVPTGLLSILTTYRWRARYKGTLGTASVWSDYSSDAAFTTASTIIAAPSVLTPANGAINIGAQPTLTSTVFAVQNGNDSHYRSRWQVSASANFSGALVYDSADTASLTQIVVPAAVLAANSTYYVRMRHVGQVLGPSAWSQPIVFQTQAVFAYVAPPSITAPSNGQLGVSLTPTVSLSAFQVIGGVDTHAKTQVQIRLASGDWGAPLYDSGELTAIVNVTVPAQAGLPADRDCVVRARYRGATATWSAWSNEVPFHTGIPSGVARYDTPGAVSGTVPVGVTRLLIHVYGAGGNGGDDGGGGGGGGGYARKLYTGLTPGATWAAIVGGPEAGPDGDVARAGTTTFVIGGVAVSATGGESVGRSGKVSQTSGSYTGGGGSGGVGSGGDLNVSANPGDAGVGPTSLLGTSGLKGGSTGGPEVGWGGTGAAYQRTAADGSAPGGGGGPGPDDGQGGKGAPGRLVIEWGPGF